MNRPRILLSTSDGRWLNYEQAILGAGGIPVGGYCPEPDLSCDGLVLTGGDDLDPALFGQPNQGSEGIDSARDRAELALVRAFSEAGKPILGICRGHQVLNVAFGGSLIQDLGPVGNLFHRRDQGVPEDKIHPLRTLPGSTLSALYGTMFVSNSAHHQGVDRLGEGFFTTAWSESGVVEAMEHTSLPILSVQFHPERMSYALRRPDTADGSKIFDWLLARCRGLPH